MRKGFKQPFLIPHLCTHAAHTNIQEEKLIPAKEDPGKKVCEAINHTYYTRLLFYQEHGHHLQARNCYSLGCTVTKHPPFECCSCLFSKCFMLLQAALQFYQTAGKQRTNKLRTFVRPPRASKETPQLIFGCEIYDDLGLAHGLASFLVLNKVKTFKRVRLPDTAALNSSPTRNVKGLPLIPALLGLF